jgi:signal transduction histidine kinase
MMGNDEIPEFLERGRPMAPVLGEELYVQKGGWFIGLRWVAIAGGLLILLVAPSLLPLDIRYERLVAILFLVGLLNGLYLWYWRRLKAVALSRSDVSPEAKKFLHVQMGGDMAALTLLLFFSGGSNNPLVFFYLFHLAIGAILFDRKQSLPYALAALGLPWALYGVESLAQALQSLWKGIAPLQPEHQKAILWAYSLTAAGLWFFLTHLVEELREKEKKLWEAGEKLRFANEELKALDIYKTRFLKQVVVRVKEPLMEVGLELGKVEKSFSEPGSQILKAMEDAKKHIWAILQLIEDLTWLSRARTQDMPFKWEWVDVYETLRKCIQSKEAQAGAKGIHFKLHGDPLVRLRADRGSFQRAVDNLISNAVQYTPQDGGDILAEFKIEGDWLEFALEDHGIGISPQNQKNLFQEFFRGPNAKRQEKFGTGLGLSIVKSILDLHGGKVRVSSEPQKGTRVDTWWPHVREESSQEKTNRDLAARPG